MGQGGIHGKGSDQKKKKTNQYEWFLNVPSLSKGSIDRSFAREECCIICVRANRLCPTVYYYSVAGWSYIGLEDTKPCMDAAERIVVNLDVAQPLGTKGKRDPRRRCPRSLERLSAGRITGISTKFNAESQEQEKGTRSMITRSKRRSRSVRILGVC